MVEIPLYVTSRKNRASYGKQTVENLIITTLPVPSKFFTQAFWTRRNITLLCYSDEDDN
jgi:hypothetical protein